MFWEIDYRDPLFGIIVFIFLVGIASLIGYYWNYFASKKRKSALIKFMQNYDYVGFDEEAKEFLALSSNPTSSILFMANMYQKSGNYEKAIRLYTTLLEYTKNPLDKVPILEYLGEAYYKAGFLKRSKEIFLEILRYYPRMGNILEKLIKIQEELGEYQEALNSTDCLEELKGDTKLQSAYLKSKILILQAKNLNSPLKKLLMLLKQEPQLLRLILSFLKDFYPREFWEIVFNLKEEDILDILDILWNIPLQDLPKIPQTHNLLNSIYEAKGYFALTPNKKATFELEVLCLLKEKQNFQGDLAFHYFCQECKGSSPLFFERCPHCGKLLSMHVRNFLKEKKHEMGYSFL
ncbi:tetratricopeptide repeat protein [Helicobacter valdiviensis]|uniref:Tetratricopeptide repeat protein n=1 Tax=Helicobacter valdiviensis TaxID=1458358 RepID=A0A2W6MXB6_9HELI|nr:tetratricopeptide repeat protein [Helicobacter valdiviensis]PZT48609.1 tetratricopeptide repeat protein [Helicobacter valdiviensis]